MNGVLESLQLTFNYNNNIYDAKGNQISKKMLCIDLFFLFRAFISKYVVGSVEPALLISIVIHVFEIFISKIVPFLSQK